MIQLIGRLSCRETRKAERFFRERNIDFHFVDLEKRALSPGEFKKIAEAAGAENMIDRNSRQYVKRGLEYMDFDPAEEMMSDQKLIITPLIRIDRTVIAGFDQQKLETILSRSADGKKQ